MCEPVCVYVRTHGEGILGILKQTSSSRSSYLFTNSASLESFLKRRFMHALLITFAVMPDQWCVHVNGGLCASTNINVLYVCVRARACVYAHMCAYVL